MKPKFEIPIEGISRSLATRGAMAGISNIIISFGERRKVRGKEKRKKQRNKEKKKKTRKRKKEKKKKRKEKKKKRKKRKKENQENGVEEKK